MCINKKDDPVRKDARELRETRIAIGGGHVGRRIAARKRLEPEQQPHRIVRDIEDKRSIR